MNSKKLALYLLGIIINFIVYQMIIFMYYFLIFFLFFFLFSFFLILKFSKRKKLNSKTKIFLEKIFSNIKNSESSRQKIIDFDKLYHKILLELWYKGSFWEILKDSPQIINNIDLVWELHKLRNRLVHDFDDIWKWFLDKKSLEYEKIVLDFLNKL